MLHSFKGTNKFDSNYLISGDSSRLLFDDAKQKSVDELLENPDMKDMFAYSYPKGKVGIPVKFQDTGRIRNGDFFKKELSTFLKSMALSGMANGIIMIQCTLSTDRNYCTKKISK